MRHPVCINKNYAYMYAGLHLWFVEIWQFNVMIYTIRLWNGATLSIYKHVTQFASNTQHTRPFEFSTILVWDKAKVWDNFHAFKNRMNSMKSLVALWECNLLNAWWCYIHKTWFELYKNMLYGASSLVPLSWEAVQLHDTKKVWYFQPM